MKFFNIKLKTDEGFIWKIVSEESLKEIPKHLIFDIKLYEE